MRLFHHRFAHQVYTTDGLTLREIAVALGLSYGEKVQRRAARTLMKINKHLALVRVTVERRDDGKRVNRYWRTDPTLSAVDVQRILQEKEAGHGEG